MKTSDMEKALKFQFELLSYGVTSRTYGKWNYRNLRNRFWRLYRHDCYGAGVTIQGKEIELLPDCFYLIPPQITFSTWNKTKINQFSVHFIINPIRGNQIYRIEATEELEKIYRDITDKSGGKKNILLDQINVIALCTCCLRELASVFKEDSMPEDLALQVICGEINAFYQDPDPLMNIASAIHMSKSRMNRLFHQKLSTSPYQFLLKRRYEYAAELLTTTELSLKEICNIISVNDVYHFSRMFKQRYGVAPSIYRKQPTNPTDKL
ncbi:MAG: helix-turn-helix transcriptional regulator [Lentisphaerae bacterium]|nr:helix-turn-helix transcriptional regulator [Lentisphaerota bacterium]